MKLVWIAQDLHIGGGQRVICELAGKFAARGHSVEVVFPRGRGGFELPDGVVPHPCGLELNSPSLSLIVNFPALIAAVPLCDWVLCSMPVSALAGYLAGKLRNAGVLYYVMNDERALFDDRTLIRSDLLIQAYHGFTDLVQRLPVKIAVNSRWTGTRVLHGRGCDYPVVPHGVDLKIFAPDGPSLGKGEIFTIVTVGRRHRWKGLSDLVEALNRLEEREEAENKFQLWIVSQDKFDLKEARFPVRVIKPESDTDIAAIFRGADLMVHPSWFEGFGLPPLEAMACGTPCVITDSGGVREYALDGQNCLITPARNPAALAEAVQTMMENADLRKKLAKNGLDTASRFTWDRAADALEEILVTPP